MGSTEHPSRAVRGRKVRKHIVDLAAYQPHTAQGYLAALDSPALSPSEAGDQRRDMGAATPEAGHGNTTPTRSDANQEAFHPFLLGRTARIARTIYLNRRWKC